MEITRLRGNGATVLFDTIAFCIYRQGAVKQHYQMMSMYAICDVLKKLPITGKPVEDTVIFSV